MEIKDFENPAFGQALRDIESGFRGLIFSGLWGASKGLLLPLLFRRLNRPLLVLTGKAEEAEVLAKDAVFFAGEEAVISFTHTGVFPYEMLPLHPEIAAQRINALYRLRHGQGHLLITSLEAVMERLPPPALLESYTKELKVGQEISLEDLARYLVETGYRSVSEISAVGEFSARGGIVDLFPPGSELPLRLEFFGDQLESLRSFDPESQRSMDLVERHTLLPMSEVIYQADFCRRALKRLLKAGEKEGEGAVPLELVDALEQHRSFAGIHHYLPFFYQNLATLWDYFPTPPLVVINEPAGLRKQALDFEAQIAEGLLRQEDRGLLFPPSPERYLTTDELWQAFSASTPGTARSYSWAGMETLPASYPYRRRGRALDFGTRMLSTYQGKYQVLASDIDTWRRQGEQVLLLCQSQAQAQKLQQVLREYELPLPILPQPVCQEGAAIAVGYISIGFQWVGARWVLVSEKEIFGRVWGAPKARTKAHREAFFSSFEDLKYDDYVVHLDHGIGRYKGLRKIELGGIDSDFLLLEYAGGDKLYVPTDKFDLVQRYIGAGDTPPSLERLGTTSWAKAKEKVKAYLREMAEGLLKLYAERQVLEGHAFGPDGPWQKEFEAAFAYEETPDQLRAIEEVKRDLESLRPMDRLVCGDVGYGKTEVALRAAFKAVMEHKQVAMLVPTTVLAQQHFNTFQERFANFPIRVEVLSRFRSHKEQKEVLKAMEQGAVDVVIGTHRLLQKDVVFKDLGLLVIDEEQRFGVTHKEKLKTLKTQVDVLVLTATPIPRTLHMAMVGLRDMSIIETPPEERLPIRTYIMPFDQDSIKEAIERELAREGQIFFVHNRVESIYAQAKMLTSLLPQAKVAVAHGQMAERELEKVMLAFYQREYDLLVCTTIIESGLDIPSVNTIIINRADKLGLAQLYQLRGRVGRDKYRAHAYLLVPPATMLNPVAQKRLKVISEFTELGAGFKLATKDLEIRGAGNLLGPEQHGHIAAVGFDLYCQLLEQAIHEAKQEKVETPLDPTIRLGVEAHIPEDYIPDGNLRLTFYKRFAGLREQQEIDEFLGELRDRFGPWPPAVGSLARLMEIKILARRLRIKEIDKKGNKVCLNFLADSPVPPERLLEFLSRHQGQARYQSENLLEVALNGQEPISRVKNVLQEFL
jgi:transcription-repair coupling factor (superfamily II helicase)